MRELILKVIVVGFIAYSIACLFQGLKAVNAQLGAAEMCAPGDNNVGPRAGIFYGIQHKDVLEFYGSPEAKSLQELKSFCLDIGFNPR